MQDSGLLDVIQLIYPGNATAYLIMDGGSFDKAIHAHPGFIRSGKIKGKHIFFEMVRESQGIQRKSQGKLGKSQGNFFGKFLPPMNQDPLFILGVVCQTSLTSYFSLYLDIFLL